MRRLLRPLALLLVLFAAGCAAPLPRTIVHEPVRYERYIDEDVDRYVDLLDYELALTHRQERRIERMLESRIRHLLEHTPARDHRRVYPFPRDRRGGDRGTLRRWWRDADRHVARLLTRRQAEEYRYLARRGYLGERSEREREQERGRGRGRGRGRF